MGWLIYTQRWTIVVGTGDFGLKGVANNKLYSLDHPSLYNMNNNDVDDDNDDVVDDKLGGIFLYNKPYTVLYNDPPSEF